MSPPHLRSDRSAEQLDEAKRTRRERKRRHRSHDSRRRDRTGDLPSRASGSSKDTKVQNEAQVSYASNVRRRSRSPNVHRSASYQPYPHFGDDLLRAERFENQLREERQWSAKLADVLQGDVGGGLSERGASGVREDEGEFEDAAWEEEMMKMRGDSFTGQVPQHIPRRWRDAAAGYGRYESRGTENPNNLDDEEYAEYMREGMYRRRHASSIAFEEERHRAWNEQQERRREAKKRRHVERTEKRQAKEQERASEALQSSRATWDAAWEDAAAAWTLAAVPWPIVQRSSPQHLLDDGLNKKSIKHFLLAESSPTDGAQRLRLALRRFHPDRFLSSHKFTSIAEQKEKAQVRHYVHIVAQILSDIVDERRA